MPLFPRFHYSPHRSLYADDLFRAFDSVFPAPLALPSHLFENTSATTSRMSARAFSPNFDVKEEEHAYTLEGEVPGLEDKSRLSIEFDDNNTLTVRGSIERAVERAGDSPGNLKTIESAAPESKKIDGGKEEGEVATTTTDTNNNKEVAKTETETEAEKKRPRYWVSERTVGEFSRSFSFPGTVNVDEVKASLENGILKIVVPKMERRATKRISVL